MTPILLLGGGGHCRSVIDVIESSGQYCVVGIVQPAGVDKTPILGYPVVGDDEAIPTLLGETPCALVTVGQVKEGTARVRLFDKLSGLKAEIPVVVSPRAYVSRHARLGRGTVVMHGAIINAAAVVHENCIINSLALLEHDVRIGSHCHVSTGARLNGGATVGSHCFIGSGTIVYHGVTIGEGSVIGAGCVVRRDVAMRTIMRDGE